MIEILDSLVCHDLNVVVHLMGDIVLKHFSYSGSILYKYLMIYT